MPEWREFKISVDAFRGDYVNGKFELYAKSIEEAQKDFDRYRKHAICGICKKPLENGDLFAIIPIQTPEEAGSLTVEAKLVHKQCWEHRIS